MITISSVQNVISYNKSVQSTFSGDKDTGIRDENEYGKENRRQLPLYSTYMCLSVINRVTCICNNAVCLGFIHLCNINIPLYINNTHFRFVVRSHFCYVNYTPSVQKVMSVHVLLSCLKSRADILVLILQNTQHLI